jgi:hypothetical protein
MMLEEKNAPPEEAGTVRGAVSPKLLIKAARDVGTSLAFFCGNSPQ